MIGDSVNLASRLEGLTRTYGVDILVGPTAGDLIRDSFHLRSVALVQVKGKTRPVEIFALIGAKNDPGTRSFSSGSRSTKPGFENSASAISRRRRSCFHSFSSSIRTMRSRRCISSGRSNMKSSRQMRRGTPWRFSKRNDFAMSGMEGSGSRRRISRIRRAWAEASGCLVAARPEYSVPAYARVSFRGHNLCLRLLCLSRISGQDST